MKKTIRFVIIIKSITIAERLWNFMPNIRVVPPEELAAQKPFIASLAAHYRAVCGEKQPMAHVRTFGCQQNVADSQRI